MSNRSVAWWHTCAARSERNPEKDWFILLEVFSCNATVHAIARFSASDGTRAWQNEFSADELATYSASQAGKHKLLDALARMSESELSEGCRVRRQESECIALVFPSLGATEAAFKLNPDILSVADFANRVALYDSHATDEAAELESQVGELQKEQANIAKKLELSVKKRMEEERNMVRGVRVLMKTKLDYFEKGQHDSFSRAAFK